MTHPPDLGPFNEDSHSGSLPAWVHRLYVAPTDAERAGNRTAAIGMCRAVASGDTAGAWMALRHLADPARGGELLDVAEWAVMLAGALADILIASAPDLTGADVWRAIERHLNGMPEAMAGAWFPGVIPSGDALLWHPSGSSGKLRHRLGGNLPSGSQRLRDLRLPGRR